MENAPILTIAEKAAANDFDKFVKELKGSGEFMAFVQPFLDALSNKELKVRVDMLLRNQNKLFLMLRAICKKLLILPADIKIET